MRVLVTGASGYVGTVVTDRLRSDNHQTQIIDPEWFAHAYIGKNAQQKPNGSDFRSLSTEDLSQVDAIIHLAAYSNDPLGWLKPEDTYQLNQHEAICFANRAKLAGVRKFVFSSTCSVFGDSGALELDELGQTAPLTPYAASKLAVETALLDMHSDTFRVAVLRGATAFGASNVPRVDLLLNELCAEAALGKAIKLQSDGTSWRPFMPVEDFARALIHAALVDPATPAETPIWNIAPPSMQMTVLDAACKAASVADAPPPVVGKSVQKDRRSYRVNGSKFLQSFPDFDYSEDFEGHIAATIAAFKSLPDLATDLDAKRFVRLASLQTLGLSRSA